MAALNKIEGIGASYQEKLKGVGVTSLESLLKAGSKPAGRKELAEKSEISPKLLLKWVNNADLFRINGIASQFAELLEAAGVDTVVELAQRNAENLHAKLVETNKDKKLVRLVPGLKKVEDFIQQAKALDRVVEY